MTYVGVAKKCGKQEEFETIRFSAVMHGYSKGYDVVDKTWPDDLKTIRIKPLPAKIIELKKNFKKFLFFFEQFQTNNV